jgi:preprotein translocase subunit SecE
MAKSGTDKPRPQDRKAVTQTRDRDRTSPGEFFSEVRGEMRKVAWPTRPEVINSTLVVIVAVVFLGATVFAFDYGAAKFVLFLFG